MTRENFSRQAAFRGGGAWAYALAGGVVAAVCGLLRALPDAFIMPVFGRVPAELAARYFNAELQTPGLVFSVRGIAYELVRPCAATDFFSMVAGLFAYVVIEWRGSLSLKCAGLLAVFPAAWLATLFTNTLRIILLVPARAMVYSYFSERAYGVVQQGVGTVVFLTVFTVLWMGVRHVKRKAS